MFEFVVTVLLIFAALSNEIGEHTSKILDWLFDKIDKNKGG